MEAMIVVEAQAREARGKNAARRLRRAGQLPAVVYGGQKPPLALTVDPRAVEKVLRSEAGHNAVFALQIKGHGKTSAMIKDWQYEPAKEQLLHVDFMRIALDVRLKVKVPVLAVGEPVGVKQQGGLLEYITREIEIESLPANIPDHFTIDVSELKIGQSARVGDLKADRRYRVLTDVDRVIAHIIAPKGVEEEKPAEEVAVAEPAEAAEPEVIRKGKAEEAEGKAAGEPEPTAKKKE
ncbi:MAG: 50S ribosomal protein L25 [Terriglobia bacterium]